MPKFVKLVVLSTVMIAIAGISTAAVDESEVLIRRVYTVADLPVFKDSKAGTEYDASILIAHLQATVAPESWMSAGTGEGEIQPFDKNASLVVSQTDRNHEKIVAVLESLRAVSKK